MRTHTLALLALTASGCNRAGTAPDTVVWVTQLRPLLSENGLLADRVLEAAAEVHDGRANPNTAALTWETEIAPLAVHLHTQAEAVQAPERWATRHEELVAIWGMRAEGYRDLSVAVAEGDQPRWQRGRALADKAKLDEEAWFKATNGVLAPEGVSLDQYP